MGKTMLLYLFALLLTTSLTSGQRSLLHWKHDLEFRLNSYLSQRQVLNDILLSSIYRESAPFGPARISSSAGVRFTDLIIPDGALVLDPQMAQPIMRIMINKTQSYVNSKLNDLYQINTQLDSIRRRINEPTQQFIYKGQPNSFAPQVNFSQVSGTRIFKQFIYGHVIESNQVDLKHINGSNVDKVLNDTYLDMPHFGVRDSQSRLFFEGKKTFWRTVFEKELRSGCCDRMKPLHTNRMMLRSVPQTIAAPVMFHTNDVYNREPVVITNLMTPQLYNQDLAVGLISNRPDDIGLIPSPPKNLIQLNNLVSILSTNPPQPDMFKNLIFHETLVVDDAQVMQTYNDNRLIFSLATAPSLVFDLSHDNRLLRHAASKNETRLVQLVSGAMVVNSGTHFLAGLNGEITNRIAQIDRFFNERVVRIDRPQIIRGSVHFYALPAMFQPLGPAGIGRSVPMISINEALDVKLVNGMNLLTDVVTMPPPTNLDIVIRGFRQFVAPVVMRNHVQVKQQVSGLFMPAEVIPLHLNDFMGSTGESNLVFMDGIMADHITIESGRFDDILLRNVQSDAQHLLMSSIVSSQPDGSHLIRAPLRVKNLRFSGVAPNQGLLNGFRPQDVVELTQQKVGIIYGKKRFLSDVEAVDCVISDINNLPNWINYLVRIDRPNTIQTINNRLAFLQPPNFVSNGTYANFGSSIHINKFNVDFLPNNNPIHYQNNLMMTPEFYSIYLALLRGLTNHTNGRYRVLDQVRLMNPSRGRVNGIALNDIVTLDTPFRFADRFVLVGKVTVYGSLQADRVLSNYPIDVMDLVQFHKYRIPITGSQMPIHLNNLVLSTNNKASFVQSRLLNGISFNEFATSIMSLTRQQVVDTNLVFSAPVNLEGVVRTESSLNGVQNFRQFARMLKSATYSFEDGLQCNVVIIRN